VPILSRTSNEKLSTRKIVSSSISDALSTLSDRGLRRLLGARTFLRGLEYEKRRSVENVTVNQVAAEGEVKGTTDSPYKVTVKLGEEGITSDCTCPAFQKSNGQHCKHVAALIITVRNRARAKMPKREQPQKQQAQPAAEKATPRRRERRRRTQAQQHSVPPGIQAPLTRTPRIGPPGSVLGSRVRERCGRSMSSSASTCARVA